MKKKLKSPKITLPKPPVSITTEISSDMKARIRVIAQREHMSMSGLTRKAIETYLKDKRARVSA